MDNVVFANINEFNTSKKTLIIITGLNNNYEDYNAIYSKYIDIFNVICLNITEHFFDDYVENINKIKTYLVNLRQETLLFISHSVGCLILYNVCSMDEMNDIEKVVVLLEPTCIESIKPIENNIGLKRETKDIIIRQINETKILKNRIINQKTILITYIQIKRLKLYINGVNNIKEQFNNFNNFNNFVDLFKNYHTLKRLYDFNEVYDTNKIHYIVLPLDETASKVVPHFIHINLPDKIILYSNMLFGVLSGGKKTKNNKNKNKNKNKKTKNNKNKNKNNKTKNNKTKK
jgi:hypothetical protein